MKTDKDPMGSAILDYVNKAPKAKLEVLSTLFDPDEIPVPYLFSKYNEMPPLEQKALQEATGNILDIGAGSGCHTLALQEMNKNVTALDISPQAIEAMKLQGVENSVKADFFSFSTVNRYDTLLMLMNGIGIVGKLENLPKFFLKIKELMSPNGKVILDSSDLCYLYEEEDGSFSIDLNADYYGEIDYQMRYKNTTGEVFDWLYIDFETLSYYAELYNFKAEILYQGEHYDYLAQLSFK